jgi:4-amino-4-deoxy-L-arabinose transferase-like glycosyltransferase
LPKAAISVSFPTLMKRWWPETLLVVLALAAFLGYLGSVELWGKREQRAAAEAIDTVDHNHWLVAQIQGRPRLEKPPLPRWSIAALMKITGCRDERVVRLPGALAGALTIALVYTLGLRMGGRELARSSALVLCSSAFFVGEMRQASNDCLLALFTTLALYAAWRKLEAPGEPATQDHRASGREQSSKPASAPGWCFVFYCALGLGFLTKGPVILLLVNVTLIPYLALGRRLSWGLRRLSSGWGFLIFAALALCWPIAVLLQDPAAARVWTLEMTEKTGLTQILEHRRHALLATQWPGMVLPWTLIAPLAVLLPFLGTRRDRARRCRETRDSRSVQSAFLWFPWWWGVGNLFVFCFWSVAKPNYYVPCMPGMALLLGAAWLELSRVGRRPQSRGASIAARGLLQAQWVVFFVAAVMAPLVVRDQVDQSVWPWCVFIGSAIACAVASSAHLWRTTRANSKALAPLAAACVIGFLVAYGRIAPLENAQRSHRTVAERLGKIVSGDSPTVMFFNEIDEGLWFYATGFSLAPVPGSHPRYNTAFDLAHSYLTQRRHSETLTELEARRVAHEKEALLDWLDRRDPLTRYLVLHARHYDLFATDLAGRTRQVLRETGMKRNELVLLEVTSTTPSPATATRDSSTRR